MARAWTKLDNAAKIFPANTTLRDPKVFRFACELAEDIDGDTLGEAVGRTLAEFPLYRSVLKRGLFWYYLEESDISVPVLEENEPPCAPLYDRTNRRPLYRVSYYNARINLEVHHALSDGTGASHFVKSLVSHYLKLRYPDALLGVSMPDYDASITQKGEDSFGKYYDPNGRAPHSAVRAYQIRGQLLPEERLHVIEGVIPVAEALAAAKARGATLTAYLAAQFMIAIFHEMPLRHRDQPVVVTVPVNLRAFYDSDTARNFFATMEVGYNFRKGGLLDDVIESVKKDFERELTPDRIGARMNQLISFEQNPIARSAPLVIKDIVLRLAGRRATRESTVSISNLGRMEMPKEMHPYIRRFSIFISTAKQQMCMCSFADQLTIGMTSAFASTEISRRFFRQLAADGMRVAIADNLIEEGSR